MAGRLLMIKFIKMKKKIIFAVATGLFVVATVFNMNVLQGNSAGDVSLDAIAVMAQAQEEGDSTGYHYVKVYTLSDGKKLVDCREPGGPKKCQA
jgi:hypothetical protein